MPAAAASAGPAPQGRSRRGSRSPARVRVSRPRSATSPAASAGRVAASRRWPPRGGLRLRERLKPLRRKLKALLTWGATRGDQGGGGRRRGTGVRASHFCRNLLAIEPARWTFARRAGVEPTNNHAERMLRPGVMWRKTSFGSHSEGGCRYAERMLMAVQTDPAPATPRRGGLPGPDPPTPTAAASPPRNSSEGGLNGYTAKSN